MLVEDVAESRAANSHSECEPEDHEAARGPLARCIAPRPDDHPHKGRESEEPKHDEDDGRCADAVAKNVVDDRGPEDARLTSLSARQCRSSQRANVAG
jgi:hypothetical protein